MGRLGFRMLLLMLLSTAARASFASEGAAEQATESAAAPVHRLDPVVVAASIDPQSIDHAPGTVTVIGREEIVGGHFTSVVDILRQVPGIHVEQPGPRGGRASIYTRGLDPNQTLILIDGVRLNDPTNNRGGSFDLSTLDPVGIERIEVVRGPTSAVHGSDAIAGVVNIVTRPVEDDPEWSVDASGGRWESYRISSEMRARKGIADFSLAGAWMDEGDYSDGQGYRAGNVKAAVGVRLPAGALLRSTLRYSNSESRAFPDDSGGEKFAVFRVLEERDVQELNLRTEASQKRNRWIDYEIAFDYYYRREDRDGPGVAPGIRNPFGIPSESARDRFDRYEISLRNTFSPCENLSTTIGGDVYWEEGSSDGAFFPGGDDPISTSFDLDRVVGGPFAEVHWRPASGLSLTGSLRADFPDSSETEVTPRVSARYRVPVVDVLLAGSWGEGFKLPAIYSLSHPRIGDSDLKSERSWGWDFSVSRSFWSDRLEGRLTYFENEVKDLIDYDSDLRRLVNRTKATSKGVEFELSAKVLDSLEFEGQLTYTNTDIVDSPVALLNRPRWRGGWTVVWKPAESVVVRLTSLAVGKVRDSSVPTDTRTLDPWVRVDLSATWRLRDRLTFYLKVDNLLDTDYEETLGFRAPGIRPRAGVQWRL